MNYEKELSSTVETHCVSCVSRYAAINLVKKADKEIAELKDFCIWLTGCGYDFTQHKYFNEKRDRLLLSHTATGSESSEVESPPNHKE